MMTMMMTTMGLSFHRSLMTMMTMPICSRVTVNDNQQVMASATACNKQECGRCYLNWNFTPSLTQSMFDHEMLLSTGRRTSHPKNSSLFWLQQYYTSGGFNHDFAMTYMYNRPTLFGVVVLSINLRCWVHVAETLASMKRLVKFHTEIRAVSRNSACPTEKLSLMPTSNSSAKLQFKPTLIYSFNFSIIMVELCAWARNEGCGIWIEVGNNTVLDQRRSLDRIHHSIVNRIL
jgi:hypothetical protein